MEILNLEKVETLVSGTKNKHSAFYLLTFKIGKVKIVSFLDTGCSSSMISLDAIKHEEKEHMKDFVVSISDVNGNKNSAELFKIKEILFGRKTVVKDINFYGVGSLNHLSETLSSLSEKNIVIDCVLGFDILEKLNAIIDFGKSTLTVK